MKIVRSLLRGFLFGPLTVLMGAIDGSAFAGPITPASSISRSPSQVGHPAHQVSQSQIYQLQAALASVLQKLVQVQGGAAGAKLIFRDLVPNDLFVSAVQTQSRFFNPQATTANTWLTDGFSGAGNPLPQNRAVGIYGIGSLGTSPQIDQVRFYLGNAALLAQIRVTPLYLDSREAVMYFNPVAWGPQDGVRIDFLSNLAIGSGVEQVDFLGITAEIAGSTIAGI